MSVTRSGSPEAVSAQMESDLASLASRAAVELDRVALGREASMIPVLELAKVIAREASAPDQASHPPLFLNPGTAIVMNRAISDAQLGPQHSKIADLVLQAAAISKTLHEIGSDPLRCRTQNPEQVTRMRSFCVALSRRASARHAAIHERVSSHPFRR